MPFKWLFMSTALSLPALGQGLALRNDLMNLGTFPCQSPDTYEFWKKGVFDSQISVSIYDFKKKFTEKVAKSLAEKTSVSKQHRGFAFGACEDSKYYVITTPSPMPAASKDLENILKESCLSFELNTTTETYLIGREHVPLKQIKDQGVSLTCFLASTTQEWFLLPPSNLMKTTDGSDLYTWINLKRQALKLPKLLIDQTLNTIAKQLNQKTTPLHDRPSLKKALLDLKKKSAFNMTTFLYEDRAIGKSLEEIKDILWWSPRHRELLLKPDAKYIGTDQSSLIQISIVIAD
jgi:hypothetical protein